MSQSAKPQSPNDSFFHWDGEVLVVNVLGKPGASRDAIGKPLGRELKVSVTAAAESGKATAHMLKFLAGEFGVAPSRIELVYGQASVHKQLRIHGPKKLPAVFGNLSPGRPKAN